MRMVLIALICLVVLMGCTEKAELQQYKIILVTGEVIYVEYVRCLQQDGIAYCYEEYPLVSPEASYKFTSFEKVK